MVLTADNYYSQEANMEYVSASQYKAFRGSLGFKGCEARAMAELTGEVVNEPTKAMLIGSYVDAWFSDELDQFTDSHPEIFSSRGGTKGQLKSEYIHADKIIARCSQDAFFMNMMDGDHQTIMTGEIAGVPVKIKMDSFDGHKIVDLKTVQSIAKHEYVKDLGAYVSFIEYWGYDTQLAIYREIVRQNTGSTLPCYICAVSKEEHPDIEVISISESVMSARMDEVKAGIGLVQSIKSGEIEPDRCCVCDYCKDTKVLSHAVSVDELGINLW